MKLEIARDWFDYVQAVGILISLLLVAGALIYAKRSSDSAKESAQAAAATAAAARQEADQTRELLRIASDQHERLVRESRRRPVLAVPALSFQTTIESGRLTLGQIASMGALARRSDQPVLLWPVVVRAVFENVGDKAADQTLARFVVPTEVGLWRSGPEGEHPQVVDLHDDELTLTTPTGNSSTRSHSWRIQHLPPGQPEALHALVVFPAPGDYEVALQAQQEEAEPVSGRFLIQVAQCGPARVQNA